MRYSLLISGSGGQGVLSAGAMLAGAAAGTAYASFVPWYGAAQRGGVARCTVVLSDEPIVSPLPGKCSGVIAMNDDACRTALAELLPGGLMIRNSDRAKARIREGGILLMDVPAETMAREAGSERMANVVLIGALLGATKLVPPEVLTAALAKKLHGSEAVTAANRRALEAGIAWGADPSHVRKLEAKARGTARYSPETTTVGEILDTPALRALVEQLFPQVLNHPLLEAGRTFKFMDAVPYMKDMLKDEDLEKFRDALEEIE